MTEISKSKKKHAPLRGSVVSVSGDLKTLKVIVPFLRKHSLYTKGVKGQVTIVAHNDALSNSVGIGSVVFVSPSKSFSKRKSWRCVSIGGDSK